MDDYSKLVRMLRNTPEQVNPIQTADAIESLQLLVKMKPAPEVREDSALIAEVHQLRAQLAAPLPEEVEAMAKWLDGDGPLEAWTDDIINQCAVMLRSLARQVAVPLPEDVAAWVEHLQHLRQYAIANGLAAQTQRAERAEAERDRYHDALIARHGGEPIALLAELDEARQEIAALRKDAERYRYQFSTGAWDCHYDWIDEPKPYVDADIDAALAAQSPPASAAAAVDQEDAQRGGL